MFRANPAYNPYYYGYNPYTAYPQQYQYPYYASNDGTQPAESAAQPGWGQYITNLFSYVPNFPTLGSESQQPSEAESQGGSSSSSSAESSACMAMKHNYIKLFLNKQVLIDNVITFNL